MLNEEGQFGWCCIATALLLYGYCIATVLIPLSCIATVLLLLSCIATVLLLREASPEEVVSAVHSASVPCTSEPAFERMVETRQQVRMAQKSALEGKRRRQGYRYSLRSPAGIPGLNGKVEETSIKYTWRSSSLLLAESLQRSSSILGEVQVYSESL